jgi:hypothetical protein
MMNTLDELRDEALAELAERALDLHFQVDTKFDELQRRQTRDLWRLRLKAHNELAEAIEALERQQLGGLAMLERDESGATAH